MMTSLAGKQQQIVREKGAFKNISKGLIVEGCRWKDGESIKPDAQVLAGEGGWVGCDGNFLRYGPLEENQVLEGR